MVTVLTCNSITALFVACVFAAVSHVLALHIAGVVFGAENFLKNQFYVLQNSGKQQDIKAYFKQLLAG